MRRFLLGITFLVLLSAQAQSSKMSSRQAKDHVGETQTVCGKVVSTRYASGSQGQPTFLNLDEPYPREIFTILIWGNNRSKFGTPETEYREKDVCVTGKITSYRGTPEIAANETSQIVVEK
jgi:DNA/RNA endonuclease YhcR with UshA esterase domain